MRKYDKEFKEEAVKLSDEVGIKQGVASLRLSPRRSGSLNESDADAHKADNLIARNFTADAPNRKWLTDITQIPCRDGKLYIAPVLDCYNGEIVGLAMDDNMKKNLVSRHSNPPANHSLLSV